MSDAPSLRFAVVGPGRAGGSFQKALTHVGAVCVESIGRDRDPGELDAALDLVLIAVPDRAIADVAARVPAGPLVVHVSGATTLAPLLAHHRRCGSMHPLLSLPNADAGAAALLAGANLAIAGADEVCERELLDVAVLLGARPFLVHEAKRAQYHAAASVSANHLVALTAQVERIAHDADLPLAPFLDMMRAVLDNIEQDGAALSLTGPTARADWATVQSHLEALPRGEHSLYLTMARACADLAGHDFPFDVSPLTIPTPSEEQP